MYNRRKKSKTTFGRKWTQNSKIKHNKKLSQNHSNKFNRIMNKRKKPQTAFGKRLTKDPKVKIMSHHQKLFLKKNISRNQTLNKKRKQLIIFGRKWTKDLNSKINNKIKIKEFINLSMKKMNRNSQEDKIKVLGHNLSRKAEIK